VLEPGLLRTRAALLRALRSWLDAQGFLEVDVPVRVRSPALEEHLEAFQVGGAWLHTSPEFALKRVLAAGLGRVYSLGPCFRDDEHGRHHGAEFTMLEWYRLGTDYRGIAQDLEALLQQVGGDLGVPVPALEHISWARAWRDHVRSPVPADPVEQFRGWVHHVEPALQRPTLVWDYPADQAAFATVRGDRAERFELYWKGVELANAFTELRDPGELLVRWQACNAHRRAAGRPPYPIDDRVVDAVGRHGPAGGIAVGVDRLLMVLLGLSDIHQARVPG